MPGTSSPLQDRIHYPGGAWEHSHPDRIAANARMYGMAPAPVERARVLELGCGAGRNLIPMACVLPEARFLGIELAARPVGIGRGLAATLALSNVELRQCDILDLPADLGEFDYIVAHGVYSWVPAPVRDALMAAFARHLAPEGVACLNFNAFPGGHLRNLARDAMRFRLAAFDDPEAHGEDAVRFVRTVAEAQPEGSPYRRILEEELERLEGNPAGVLFHDDLAPDHQAFHFRHVVEHAARHGLQYLCEARPADVHPDRYPAAVRAALRRTGGDRIAAAPRRVGGDRIATVPPSMLTTSGDAGLRRTGGDRIAAAPPSVSTTSGDPALRRSSDDHIAAALRRTAGGDRIAREQCFDFLVCQMYRCSLFCREGVALAPHADPERMSDLRAASAARPEPAPADLTDGIPATFRAPDGAAARIDDSAAKAALELLAGRWPASAEVEALLRDARRRAGRTGGPTPLERREFAAFLASGHASGLVDLHTWEPPMTTAVGERPVASALARTEVAHGSRVTSLRHRPVDIDDPVAAAVLARLDGARDFETLRKDVGRAFPGMTLPADYLRMVLAGLAHHCLLEK